MLSPVVASAVSTPVLAPTAPTPVLAPVVPTPIVAPAVPAPVAQSHSLPGFAGGPDHDVPSPRRRAATRKAYERMETGVLRSIPQLPFANDHNVSDLMQFTSALRDAVASLRVACDAPHPYLWTRGWEKYLERHVMRAVRSTTSQASTLTSMITEAFAQGGRLQDEGWHGPDVLQHAVRFLCRGLSRATPAAVMLSLIHI